MSFPPGSLIRDRSQAEAGYGRVLQPRDDGFALVAFPDQPAREMRLKGQDDVMRARLHAGQRVEVRSKADDDVVLGVVLEAVEAREDRLWSYQVRGKDEDLGIVTEAWLTPIGPKSKEPLDLLKSLYYRGPRGFFARCDLLRTVSLWYENSFGIPAFLGARIKPMAHQIHAARRVLCDRLPRFVLADEVGLGKTIEAGLVIQALAATDPTLRVLVIAPGAMSRQWLLSLIHI